MSATIFAKNQNDFAQNLDENQSNQQSDDPQQEKYNIVQQEQFQKDQKNYQIFFGQVSILNSFYFALLCFFSYVIMNFLPIAQHFYKSHNLGFYLVPYSVALVILKLYLAYDNKHSQYIIAPLFCVDLFISLKIILGLMFIGFDNSKEDSTENNGLLLLKINGCLVMIFLINFLIKYFASQKFNKLIQIFLIGFTGIIYLEAFQRFVLGEVLSIKLQLINSIFIIVVSSYIILQENLLQTYEQNTLYKKDLLKIFYHYQVDWLFLFLKNLLKQFIKQINSRKQNTQKIEEQKQNKEETKDEEKNQEDQDNKLQS